MLLHYILAPIAAAILAAGWIIVRRAARAASPDDCDAPEARSGCGGCDKAVCPSRAEPG